jgi:hypothetical protein
LLPYWAKNEGQKAQIIEKDRNGSFSRFDNNLVKKDRERKRGKGALKRDPS